MENVHSFHMGWSKHGEEPGESFLGKLLSPADGWMASQNGPARPGLTLLTSLRQSVMLPHVGGGRDSAPCWAHSPRGMLSAGGGRGFHRDPCNVPDELSLPV